MKHASVLLTTLLAVSCLAGCTPKPKPAATTAAEASPVVTDSLSKYYPTLPRSGNAFDFELPDSAGVMHALHDFKDKWVIVDFWASWCGDCRADMADLKSLYRICKDDVVFIGISFDTDPAQWKAYISQQNLPWLQLCDFTPWHSKQPDGTQKTHPVAQAYGLHWIPTLFLISPYGTISRFALKADGIRQELDRTVYDPIPR